MKNRIVMFSAALLAAVSCGQSGWTGEESKLILDSGSVMRVLTVCDPQDSLVPDGNATVSARKNCPETNTASSRRR